MRRSLVVAALCACAGCSAGPDDPGLMYMPEMVESTAYDAHDRNPVLPRRMTLQAPPEGSIPRGYQPYHYGAGPEEATAAEAVTSPLSSSEAELARGRRVFETFCSVCHGRGGDGDGTVVPPFPNPPSLKTDRARALSDGRLFHVITRGQNLMPSYAMQVREDDRWRVILYLRSLQGSAPAAEGPDAGVPEASPPDAGLAPAPDAAADASVPEAPASDASVIEAAVPEEAPALEAPSIEAPAAPAPTPGPADPAPAPEPASPLVAPSTAETVAPPSAAPRRPAPARPRPPAPAAEPSAPPDETGPSPAAPEPSGDSHGE